MAQQLCQSLSTQQAQQGLAQAQPRFGCIWDAWYNGITPELSPMSGPLWRPKYLRKGRAAPRAQSGVAPPSTGGQKTSGVKARGLAQTKHNRRGEPDSVGAFYFRAAGGRVVDFSFPRSTRLTMTAQPSSSGRRRTVVWAPAVPGDPRDTAFPWGGCRPTSLLQSGVDSTPERQRERATFWLTSQEKQSTEGAGQGRRSVPLKERKREGEGVTFKKREGRWQLGPGGLSHGAPAQRGRGGDGYLQPRWRRGGRRHTAQPPPSTALSSCLPFQLTTTWMNLQQSGQKEEERKSYAWIRGLRGCIHET